MKITKRQLKRIIRETIRSGWMEDDRPSHIRSGNPNIGSSSPSLDQHRVESWYDIGYAECETNQGSSYDIGYQMGLERGSEDYKEFLEGWEACEDDIQDFSGEM